MPADEFSTHQQRITDYFLACSEGAAEDIAAHFTPDAVIYDTNTRPMIGADQIGAAWVEVRDRWGGARWTVDSFVGDGESAAIEWAMTGTAPHDRRSFVFHGSEHYVFEPDGDLIREIRQYWTFDSTKLDTGLRGYDY